MSCLKFFTKITIFLLIYISCNIHHNDSYAEESNARPIITTTTTILSDTVAIISGKYFSVQTLMESGVDPHLYKSTAYDIQKLTNSNIIFYNGLMLEGRISNLLGKLSKDINNNIYSISSNIPKNLLIFPENKISQYDPHIWFDLHLWSYGIDLIVSVLSNIDPFHYKYFNRQGYKVYINYELLLNWCWDYIVFLPVSQRVLITSHDAYNYYGRIYGFQVIGAQGSSTISEPGLADITKIIDFIEFNKIKAIFAENSVSPTTISQISRSASIKIGGELFSDALGVIGVKITGGDSIYYNEGSYQDVMRYNITIIVNNLI